MIRMRVFFRVDGDLPLAETGQCIVRMVTDLETNLKIAANSQRWFFSLNTSKFPSKLKHSVKSFVTSSVAYAYVYLYLLHKLVTLTDFAGYRTERASCTEK